MLNITTAETLAADQHKIERLMLGITLHDGKSYTFILQQTGVKDITETVKKNKRR